CDARHLILPDNMPYNRAAGFSAMARQQSIHLISAQCENSTVDNIVFPDLAPEHMAFLQYTSGSTTDPRGVQLTHHHLLTNIRQMIAGMKLTAQDVFVSWLPVYHDMGLILMTMAPFYLGARLILLPASLRHVHPWLHAITIYRGTFTAAPDIAYRLCMRSIRNPDAYDLTSLRVALNAAEPVRPWTMEAFEDAFGLQHTMVAGYGLAEATVGVCMWPPGTPKKVDADDHVSVGQPFPGIEILIVDGDNELPSDTVGEIALHSPANTSGYMNNPTASTNLWWHDDYLLTGDLGYLDAEGHLFIVGRKKNLIIQAGHTLYPNDVEGAIQSLPAVRQVAAVGIERPGTTGEHLYLFVELRQHRAPDADVGRHLVATIVQRVHSQFGIRPARVFLLKPQSLPFTPNGKLQHHRLKEMYLNQQLKERILFPDY
ncbi:MAG TPA: AMP-binding protein, partial [Rhodothermales bacterium]|nr:AMP-binding protein [Rhodothermales bacterium]